MVCANAPLRAAAVHGRDRPVPDVFYRHRHKLVADDRALSIYAVAGLVIIEHAGLPPDRHTVSSANHHHVHSLVLLGLSRKGARRHRLSLRSTARRDRLVTSDHRHAWLTASVVAVCKPEIACSKLARAPSLACHGHQSTIGISISAQA